MRVGVTLRVVMRGGGLVKGGARPKAEPKWKD